MKAIGIVAEFNPLHNGHLHLINEARRLSYADVVIVVLSGYFSMRGEVAPIDKLTKTKHALAYGIDLVIELPTFYTLQNADIFALKSIEILNHLFVEEIYFGSETNDLDKLTNLADITSKSSYNDELKTQMQLGFSYKEASMKAFAKCGYQDIKANDILGLSYIKALNSLNSNIKPVPIKRIASDYFDTLPKDSTIASATAIRNLHNIENYVPKLVQSHFQEYGFNNWDNYYDLLAYKIKSLTALDFSKYWGASEGLSQLMAKIEFSDYNSLINDLVSRRYTKSRIQRLLCCLLLEIDNKLQIQSIPYIRVLGMNKIGTCYLHDIKKNMNIPLITKLKKPLNDLLLLELKVAKIYSLKYPFDVLASEMTAPLIIEE